MITFIKKSARAGLLLACALFGHLVGQSQVPIPAFMPDQPIASSSGVGNINCDMLECPLQGGVRLSAIVWDNFSPGVCSLYVDYTGNPSPVQIALPPTPSGSSAFPDVVIGNVRKRDDKKGTHVIGVIYLDPANYVTYYSWYYVNGVGGPLSVTLGGTTAFSGAYGPYSKYPHIDGFADNMNLTGGLPSIYEFAATWEEHLPSGIITVGAVGSIDNPGIVPTYQISGPSSSNTVPDVACVTDVISGSRTALFAYNYLGGVQYAEFDAGTSTVTSTTNYATFSSRVRIEAMNLYNAVSPSTTKYQIAAEVISGTDIDCYNDTYYPSVSGGPLTNADPTIFPSATGYTSPAVAAGTGIGGPAGNIGNDVYTIGMSINGTGYLYARQIDINTGTFPGTPGGNDYYAINKNPLGSGGYPLGITSSSNSGFDLLSAWFDGGNIMTKYSGNVFAFKHATGVANTARSNSFTLSPNPASEKLTIKGNANADYVILDATGKTVARGTLQGLSNDLDISHLSRGLYLVQLVSDGARFTCRFVKE